MSIAPWEGRRRVAFGFRRPTSGGRGFQQEQPVRSVFQNQLSFTGGAFLFGPDFKLKLLEVGKDGPRADLLLHRGRRKRAPQKREKKQRDEKPFIHRRPSGFPSIVLEALGRPGPPCRLFGP